MALPRHIVVRSYIFEGGFLLTYSRCLNVGLAVVFISMCTWFLGVDVFLLIKTCPIIGAGNTSHFTNIKDDLLYAVIGHPDGHQVHHSSVQDVVSCVKNLSLGMDRPVRIYFIGDSRIRQQFYSFLEVMPEYDLIWDGLKYRETTTAIHFNMNATFPILNVQVLFRWRPVINDTVIAEIQNLPEMASTQIFLLIGMNLHHMLARYAGDHRDYVIHLNKLAKAIQSLTVTRAGDFKAFWMMNQDMLDSNMRTYVYKTLPPLHQAKVRQYNALARNVLQRYKELELVEWNSYSVDDYIKACELQQRKDKREIFNCFHALHLGYNIIRLNTQSFIDRLCNNF